MMLSLLCILAAFLCGYLASHKKKNQKNYTFLQPLNQRPRLCRSLAGIFYLLATLLLSQQAPFSIAFISFWIFASPIAFLLILCVNPLTQKRK